MSQGIERLLSAAYGHYLSTDHTERGQPYTIAEPHLDAEALATGKDADMVSFLNLRLFDSTSIRNSPEFIRLYTQFRADIRHEGIIETLKKIA